MTRCRTSPQSRTQPFGTKGNDVPDQALRTITERRLRLASILICLGLLVFLLSLLRVHPLAFITFTLIACPLVIVGIVFFLYSILSHAHGG